MNKNLETLNRFYSAFAALDADTMARCYDASAHFQDPAFTLQGSDAIAGMWQMLCSATREKGMAHWKFEYKDLQADAKQGQAHWEAHYLFPATGRVVHNIIDAQFRFNDQGLIVEHRDDFNFWRWSRQALGAPGWALGWTPFFQSLVKKQASSGLKKFMAKRTK
jgi:hypothetical protein